MANITCSQMIARFNRCTINISIQTRGNRWFNPRTTRREFTLGGALEGNDLVMLFCAPEGK